MREAEINGEKVCIKGLRTYAQGNDDTIKKVRPSVIRHWGASLKRLDRQKFYEEVVVWKRLQHQNIVPCLGVPTGRWLPFEIVCSWMENGKITDYVGKYPDVDRINLVSVFASTITVSFRRLYIAAVGCSGRSSFPPLLQNNTRGSEGCKFDFSFAALWKPVTDLNGLEGKYSG